MATLSARTRLIADLTDSDVNDMYALLSAYYDATSFDRFRSDLANKSHVIELAEEDELCGFSTLALIEAEVRGRAVRAIFSGDTIIQRCAWGEQALATAFCEYAGRISLTQPEMPLYWFLISKGYRTYRYLHLFAKSYLPHFEAAGNDTAQLVLDVLARQRFGEYYDSATGLIRFPSSCGHLKADWAGIRKNLLARPEIRFFLEHNPGYVQGHELACIAELKPDNLRSFALRAFMTGRAQVHTSKDAA